MDLGMGRELVKTLDFKSRMLGWGFSSREHKQRTILFETEGLGEGMAVMLSGGGETKKYQEPGLDS